MSNKLREKIKKMMVKNYGEILPDDVLEGATQWWVDLFTQEVKRIIPNKVKTEDDEYNRGYNQAISNMLNKLKQK